MASGPSCSEPAAPDEDSLADTPIQELEQVAENTSRKLLILLAIGAILFTVLNTTPIGQQVRDWDTLARIFSTGGLWAEVNFMLISTLLITIGVPQASDSTHALASPSLADGITTASTAR